VKTPPTLLRETGGQSEVGASCANTRKAFNPRQAGVQISQVKGGLGLLPVALPLLLVPVNTHASRVKVFS